VTIRHASTLLTAAALSVVVAACGSTASNTTNASNASASSTGGAGGLAAAQRAVAPYIGQPSPFPATQSLKRRPVGATLDYVDCGTPTCALMYSFVQPAANTIGMKLNRILAGSSASGVQNALASVVAQKPAAMILPGLPWQLIKKQVLELKAEGVKILLSGVTGTGGQVGVVQPSDAFFRKSGKLMADYVAAEWGPESHVAFYAVPELPFTALIDEGFTSELKAVCARCTTRTVQFPIASIGNTAPTQAVSDLQQSPNTTAVIFGTGELEAGVPAALRAAGISNVKSLSFAPGPAALEDIKNGTSTAALAYDLVIQEWTQVDQGAREIDGQSLTGPEADGLPVVQFLTQHSITFDPAKGWTGYPNFAARFAKLWGAGGGA
jgi:ribose transport system substrate-binding protein